jgi:hypothetical protein
MKQLPRGLRNNNPGNIRKSPTKYVGEIDGNDQSFKTFKSIEYGYRALLRDLRNKINRGLNTVDKIITVYAPPFENNTQAYINYVCKKMNIEKNTLLTIDKQTLISLCAAISTHENGIEADLTSIEKGYILIDATV